MPRELFSNLMGMSRNHLCEFNSCELGIIRMEAQPSLSAKARQKVR